MTALATCWTAASILDAAASATGIDAEPRGSFVEALELLVEDWRDWAARPGTLAANLGLELARVSEQHLRLRAARVEGTIPVGPDDLVVITGPPRTGSTLLHALLASRRDATFVPLHRALRPGGSEREARQLTEVDLAYMRDASPRLLATHPMGVDLPEECLTLLQLTGWSERFLFYGAAPRYTDALLGRDLTDAYEDLAHLLRVAAPPGRTLVIKNPGHQSRLPLLARFWPRLRVVWLHREPVAAFASFCGLVASTRQLFTSKPVDVASLGREWLPVLAHHRAGMVASRRGLDVIDVDYEDLVADPGGTVDAIVGRLGGVLGHEAVARALPGHEVLTPNPHRWTVEQFGVTPDDVRAAFPPAR